MKYMDIKRYKKQIYNRRHRYGIEQGEYDYMVLKQGFECPICHSQLHNGNTVIDHNHGNELTRDIICNNCNVGLGHFKDDPDIVDSAYKYLKSHSEL